MRNALMIYPSHDNPRFNIGDYIQSIAARQFLPSVDAYIDRERLNTPQPEETRMILNGWFMHNPQNWPPTPELKPLFVALHINKLAEDKMLAPESVEYFKQHEPIGCRDRYTASNLRNHGVDAYFSGCLTLTLGETYKRTSSDNSIYLTDLQTTRLPDSMEFRLKSLLNLVSRYPLLRKIQKRQKECGLKMSIKSVAAFYTTYHKVIAPEVMVSACYEQQSLPDTFNSEEEKFEYADQLLKRYLKAKYVVTTRIHCALPCLAMGVPVVFVHNENLGTVHNCRMDGLIQLFHKILIKGDKIKCEISQKPLSFDSTFVNKEDYKSLAQDLAKRCREFFKA